jgi:predicted enzyme related to lactoylglutathione lyase
VSKIPHTRHGRIVTQRIRKNQKHFSHDRLRADFILIAAEVWGKFAAAWTTPGFFSRELAGFGIDFIGNIMYYFRHDLSDFSRSSYSQGKYKKQTMNLGAFSISLAVKDIAASKTFYEILGFQVFLGDISQNWLIMKSGDHTIGLFQGMFQKNILTFNPGWDQNAQKLDSFTDIRVLQRQLKAQGVELASEADENTTGPANFLAVDPDGNPILFDQHV